MEAPQPKKERRLLAGTDGREGREGEGRRRPQSTRTPATWAPHELRDPPTMTKRVQIEGGSVAR